MFVIKSVQFDDKDELMPLAHLSSTNPHPIAAKYLFDPFRTGFSKCWLFLGNVELGNPCNETQIFASKEMFDATSEYQFTGNRLFIEYTEIVEQTQCNDMTFFMCPVMETLLTAC